jgi:hypothetical protein
MRARGSITKSDRIVSHRQETVVRNSHSKDVRSQITQGTNTKTNRLAVNNPSLRPDRRQYLLPTIMLFQGIPKLSPKENRERFDRQQEAFVPAVTPHLAIPSTSGHEVMDMRMKRKVASPCM